MKAKEAVHNKTYIVGAYTRLSREDEGDKIESDSIANQGMLIKQFIMRNEDMELFRTYDDDGYTGTNFNRPAFQQMIQDIKDQHINCVIVKDLSRFGRDYIGMGKYLENDFSDWNIRFIAINDNIDTFKQDYDALFPIRNVFNQTYAVDISKKVKSSFKVKQMQGQFIGAFACYGYKKVDSNHNKLEIDPYAAQVVKRIFNLYLEGCGKIRIAKLLNDERVPCPSEYKKQSGFNYNNGMKINKTTYWTYSTIHRMLKNEMYIGNLVQNTSIRKRMHGKAKVLPKEEWIIVKNTHPAIIEVDTWNAVQSLLKRSARQNDYNSNISIFAGFLKCGDCGRAMVKTTYKNSNYYSCGSYKRYGADICTKHSISQAYLEKIILDDFNDMLQKVPDIEKIVKEETEKHDKEMKFNKAGEEKERSRIYKLHLRKKQLYDDYKDGIITRDEFFSYGKDYDEEIRLCENKLKMLSEDEKGVNFLQSEMIQKLLKYKRLDHLTRCIIADIIHEIKVFEKDGRIVVHIEYTFESG